MRILFVLILASTFLYGCSQSPEQSSEPAPQEQDGFDRDAPKVPETGAVVGKPGTGSTGFIDLSKLIRDPGPGEDLVGGAKNDDLIKDNSSKDIFYALGAGGITFETTLEESTQLLAKPRTPIDGDGRVLYEEGLYVFWRNDEPRTPSAILVLSSYLGKVQVPAPHKPFGINEDFSDRYGKNSREGADQLARDIYNIFNGTDEAFDCLPKGFCTVDWGTDEQKNYVVDTPGILLLISKDRNVLFRMLVKKAIPLGDLASDLDVINGRFDVADVEPIQFGDSYENIEKRLNITTDTNVGTTAYGRSYGGAWLGYHRTKYARENTEPLETDQLKALQVWSDYKRLLTIDGKPLMVKEYEDRVELELVFTQPPATGEFMGEFPTDAQKMSDHRVIPLQVNMGLQRENVLPFTNALTELLKKEFAKKFPGRTIFSRTSGQFQKKQIKEYTTFIVAYDDASGEGLLVQYDVGEELGNIGSFYMGKFGSEFNPFDSLIIPQALAPVTAEATYKELSGFKIGDELKITDWDLGRSEATVTMGERVARVDYFERDTQNVAFTSEKTAPRTLSFIEVGSLSVTLGLKLMKADTPDNPERVYKVVSVGSNIKDTEVQGLCGDLSIKFGTNDKEFLKELRAQENCDYLPVLDAGGNGNLEAIYFPQKRIRLGFGDQQFLATTIYAPKSEVK